jgi:hypothetical protein
MPTAANSNAGRDSRALAAWIIEASHPRLSARDARSNDSTKSNSQAFSELDRERRSWV